MNFATKLSTTLPLCLAVLVSACAQPMEGTRSEEVVREVRSVFGDPSQAGLSEQDPDGRGMYVFRGYSELPFPERFDERAPERYGNTLVVDFALDFQDEAGFPLYRIGVRPRKILLDEVRSWPGYVSVNASPAEGRPSRLVAQLPRSRALDENGFLWSELTYCSECFELRRLPMAAERGDDGALELVDRGLAAAHGHSFGTSDFEGQVNFIGYAEEGILWGDEARRMAPIAAAEVNMARVGLAAISPARAAYADFALSYARESTPAKAMVTRCGVYEPSSDMEMPIEVEWRRMEGYAGCMTSALEDYDRVGRMDRITALVDQEARLAAAGVIGTKNRIRIDMIDEEFDKAWEGIQQVRREFNDWRIERLEAERPTGPVTPSDLSAAGIEVSPAAEEKPVPVVPEGEMSAVTAPAQDSGVETPPKADGDGPLCVIEMLCPDQH